MKLTRASSYAVHAVAYMAEKRDDKPVASHHIAAARDIPERFLLKVLKPLVSARVLNSIKGPNGGYTLAKDPAKVSLLDVIEAVDGPIQGNSPFSREEGDGALNAKLAQVCKMTAEKLRDQLAKVKLADLVSRKKLAVS